jgi:hypothetical protein
VSLVRSYYQPKGVIGMNEAKTGQTHAVDGFAFLARFSRVSGEAYLFALSPSSTYWTFPLKSSS